MRESTTDVSIIWLDARNPGTFKQSLSDLEERLEIDDLQHLNPLDIDIIRSRLEDRKHGRWLLILDNVEHSHIAPASIANTGGKKKMTEPIDTLQSMISRFLPSAIHGTIVFISSSIQAVTQIAPDVNILEIPRMTTEESLTLLNQKSQRNFDSDDAKQLLIETSGIPRLLSRAGTDLYMTSSTITPKKYLEQLRDPMSQLRLQEAYTLGSPFTAIRSIRPSAVNLLAFMSFCDPDKIPRRLVRGIQNITRYRPYDKESDRGPEWKEKGVHIACDVGFEDDLALLKDRFLIRARPDDTMFRLDRFIRRGVHNWLRSTEALEFWMGCFVKILVNTPLHHELEDEEELTTLPYNPEVALELHPQEKESKTDLAHFLYHASDKALKHAAGRTLDRDQLQIYRRSVERSVDLREHVNLSSRPDIINKEMQLLRTVYGELQLWQEYGIADAWLERRGNQLPW